MNTTSLEVEIARVLSDSQEEFEILLALENEEITESQVLEAGFGHLLIIAE